MDEGGGGPSKEKGRLEQEPGGEKQQGSPQVSPGAGVQGWRGVHVGTCRVSGGGGTSRQTSPLAGLCRSPS